MYIITLNPTQHDPLTVRPLCNTVIVGGLAYTTNDNGIVRSTCDDIIFMEPSAYLHIEIYFLLYIAGYAANVALEAEK